MTKLIQSTFAKIVAVLLLVSMVVTFVLSTAAIYILSRENVYFDDGTTLRYKVYDSYIQEVKQEIMNNYVEPYHSKNDNTNLKSRYSYLTERYAKENSNVFFTVKYSDGTVFFSNYQEPYARFEYSDEMTFKVQEKYSKSKGETVPKIYFSIVHDEAGEMIGVQTEKDAVTESFGENSSQTDNELVNEKFTFTAYVRKTLTVKDKLYYMLTIVNFFTENRYLLIGICAGSLLFAVFMLLFLICSAGHQKGTDEICLSSLDEVPLDLYAAFVAAATYIISLFVYVIYRYYGAFNIVITVTAIGVGMLLSGLLTLSLVLTFATRFKYGKWWKNTIVYRVLNLIYRIISWFAKKMSFIISGMPLVWKTVLIFIGLSLIELAVLIHAGRKTVLLWWLVEKIIVGGIVLFIVIDMKRIQKGGEELAKWNTEYKVDAGNMFGDFKKHALCLNSISEGMQKAVNDKMKSERLKTELITNVSHDLKTPLTSIVNYVDLMKKEDIKPEKAKEYLEVLDRQSRRLQKLTTDLVEASKASTGNIKAVLEPTDINVFLSQIEGEYSEKLEKALLEPVIKFADENTFINADGRLLWRVLDNLMNNICKYALENTRVYIKAEAFQSKVRLEFKNISKYPLGISSDELMERFVRGDRSRNTEGSGLGLSIAKSLTELQNGSFDIIIDGDLFKAVLEFKVDY